MAFLLARDVVHDMYAFILIYSDLFYIDCVTSSLLAGFRNVTKCAKNLAPTATRDPRILDQGASSVNLRFIRTQD